MHGLWNGHYVPLVFTLLSDKTQTTYKYMWDAIIFLLLPLSKGQQCLTLANGRGTRTHLIAKFCVQMKYGYFCGQMNIKRKIRK